MADKILEKLVVEIRTDQKKLNSEMSALKGDMKKQGDKLGSSFFSGFGNAIKGIGATVVLSQVISFVKKSINLYAQQEAAEKRLSVAYGKNIDNLVQYASALQSVTAYGDEEIIEAQALISAFVKEEDSIKRATKATLDLAAAKGMDLKTAADLLSKTLGSSTNALSRYGIEVNGAVGSAERLDSAMENLNAKFGGQAEAQLETYTGKVKALGNAWGDVLEKVGKVSVDAIFAGIQSIFSGGNNFAIGFSQNLYKNAIQEQFAKIAKEIEDQYKQNVPAAIQKTITTVNSLEDEIKKLGEELNSTDITDIASRDRIQRLISAKQQIIDNFLNPIKKEIEKTFGFEGLKGILEGDWKTKNVKYKPPTDTVSYSSKMPIIDPTGINYVNESLSKQKSLWADIGEAQSVAMGNLASSLVSNIQLFSKANSVLQQFLNTLLQVGLQQIAISAIGSFSGGGILGGIGGLFKSTSSTSSVNGKLDAINNNLITSSGSADTKLSAEITNRSIYLSNKRGLAQYNKIR